MTLKTNENDPKYRGREDREFELRTIWLGRKDSNPCTFTTVSNRCNLFRASSLYN